MKKILSPIILSIFIIGNLFAQEPIKLCAQVDKVNGTVEVNIYASDFVNIGSYQFGVAWEASKYQFVSIGNLNDAVPASYNLVDDASDNIPSAIGLMRTLWFDDTGTSPQTIDDESLLFTIVLSQNDPSIDGLIGIAPNEDFLIEFTSGYVELVDYVLEDTGCSVLPFSTVTNTSEVEIQELIVSPNPFNNEIQINLTEAANGNFSIYSTTGKLIKQYNENNNKNVTLQLEHLEPGTYILSYESKDGKTLGQSKIVKL